LSSKKRAAVVVEHLPVPDKPQGREKGFALIMIKHCARVARVSIKIFTKLIV
jgi:hypothetical protein